MIKQLRKSLAIKGLVGLLVLGGIKSADAQQGAYGHLARFTRMEGGNKPEVQFLIDHYNSLELQNQLQNANEELLEELKKQNSQHGNLPVQNSQQKFVEPPKSQTKIVDEYPKAESEDSGEYSYIVGFSKLPKETKIRHVGDQLLTWAVDTRGVTNYTLMEDQKDGYGYLVKGNMVFNKKIDESDLKVGETRWGAYHYYSNTFQGLYLVFNPNWHTKQTK